VKGAFKFAVIGEGAKPMDGWYDLSPIAERQTGSENLLSECPCAVRVALKTPNEKKT